MQRKLRTRGKKRHRKRGDRVIEARRNKRKRGERKKERKKSQKKESQIIWRRNRVERIFGVGKRRYGLNLIQTKLKETSETKIAMGLFVMNLMTLLLRVLKGLFLHFYQKQLKSRVLNKNKLYINLYAQSLNYKSRLSHIYNVENMLI